MFFSISDTFKSNCPAVILNWSENSGWKSIGRSPIGTKNYFPCLFTALLLKKQTKRKRKKVMRYMHLLRYTFTRLSQPKSWIYFSFFMLNKPCAYIIISRTRKCYPWNFVSFIGHIQNYKKIRPFAHWCSYAICKCCE